MARCWHTIDLWLACGGSLFYSPWGDRRVTVCVWRWWWAPRRQPQPTRSSSAQVKHSNKVVPASAGWEEKPPFTVIRSLISMVWRTDVFYVEKCTRVYTGGAFWLILWWLFLIVFILSISPVFLQKFDELLSSRVPGWPVVQMEGRGSPNLSRIF